MQKKTFLVTNGSDGAISLVGRTRITIPGNCKEHPIILSADNARGIISRLKRTYPLLKIVEAPEQKTDTADPREQQATTSAPEAKAAETAPVSSSTAEAKAVTPASEAGSAQNSAKKK